LTEIYFAALVPDNVNFAHTTPPLKLDFFYINPC